MDQPGSTEALHMKNKEGKAPEDIARDKGMMLLADMFSRYLLLFFILFVGVLVEVTGKWRL